MRIGPAVFGIVLLCMVGQVTSSAEQPPRSYVAGFGRSIDEHMDVVYRAYARTLEVGTVDVRLECRPMGSDNPRDWSTMGLGVPVGNDSLLWAVEWQPCLFSGRYELRMVASDSSGVAPDLQPILHVNIDNCRVTPVEQSESLASAWFDVVDLDGPCIVNVEGSEADLRTTMIAVYEDQIGNLATERIRLFQPDPDDPASYAGSFDPSPIRHGGVGRFWTASNDYDHLTTRLSCTQLTVGCGAANWDYRVANDQICACVQVHAGTLADDNCIVLYPSHIPTQNSGSLIQIWPSCAPGNLATAIRLTGPRAFIGGAYVQVQISYRASAPDECLAVVRVGNPSSWGADLLQGEIGGGIAVFNTPISELEGVYAVVSELHCRGQQAPLPTSTRLAQNYPNPFNSSTVIPFDLEKEGDWTLDVFNIAGQNLRTFTGHDVAGRLRVTWDGLDSEGRQAVSGTYFYRFTNGDYTATKAMTLLR